MKVFTQSKTVVADHLTPISTYNNLRNNFSGVSLFESSDYHDKSKSKSFICVEPLVVAEIQDNQLSVFSGQSLTQKIDIDTITDLQAILDNYEFTNTELAAKNGFFGVIGYDAIPYTEDIKFKGKSRFEELPDVQLNLYKYIIVFDNFRNEIEILCNTLDEKEEVHFSEIVKYLQIVYPIRAQFSLQNDKASNFSNDEFLSLITKAKEHITQGDVFQLVLSRSFKESFSGDEFEVYRKLRTLNPSPYMFFFDLGKAKLLGTSPEAHLVIKKGVSEIHPIAGTYKKTGNVDEDKKAGEELSQDPKENAEHNMLVDLARNDLNATCDDVEVVDFKTIQEFSHVIHMVSKVQGKLKSQTSYNFETFAKTFPAGTLSGAPKYKALELIDAYENTNRGYYGGAIGHFAPNGDMNVAIIIRSCLSYKGTLNYQAGAGVVKDSIPQNELTEINNKVGAVEKAIQLAKTDA